MWQPGKKLWHVALLAVFASTSPVGAMQLSLPCKNEREWEQFAKKYGFYKLKKCAKNGGRGVVWPQSCGELTKCGQQALQTANRIRHDYTPLQVELGYLKFIATNCHYVPGRKERQEGRRNILRTFVSCDIAEIINSFCSPYMDLATVGAIGRKLQKSGRSLLVSVPSRDDGMPGSYQNQHCADNYRKDFAGHIASFVPDDIAHHEVYESYNNLIKSFDDRSKKFDDTNAALCNVLDLYALLSDLTAALDAHAFD